MMSYFLCRCCWLNGRNFDAGLTFPGIPACSYDFWTSNDKFSTRGSCVWTCRVLSLSPPEASTSTCRVYFFHLHKVFKMPDCPPSGQSDTVMNKNADAGPVRYWNKGTQSGNGTLLYRIEKLNAGMPMPAASAPMPVPSYGVEIEGKINRFFNVDTCFPFS